LLDNKSAGEHGSRASFGGYFLSLGFISVWDAHREGKQIAEAIINKNDKIDRGIGHSQGVRICLEGINQAAFNCSEYNNLKVLCCRKNKKIRLVLAAPKTSSSYIDNVYKKVMELQPGWDFNVLLIYSTGDWLVPNSDIFPIPGNYVPTSFATSNYSITKISAPFPYHSSESMLGRDVPESTSKVQMVEDKIRRFLNEW
jgi:hypothetical protein